MKISKKRNHVLNVAAFAWISPALLTRAALFLVPARTTANNKEQLLLDLVSRAVASLNLGLEAIFNALRAREELDPTGLDEGFALPRARIARRDRLFGMFARRKRPVLSQQEQSRQ
jgi:mannitol/fructose-specific phosphotransferase system IIA component (Ntr-type)